MSSVLDYSPTSSPGQQLPASVILPVVAVPDAGLVTDAPLSV